VVILDALRGGARRETERRRIPKPVKLNIDLAAA
jgi:hypothetical protein